MSTDCRTNRAWVELRADALRRNLRRIVAAVGPGVPVIPMVKADAYGLGALGVVDALEPEGPAGYGVATVGEGRALREHGIDRPVVVFTPLAPQDHEAAVAHGLTVSVSSLAGLAGLAAAAEAAGGTVPFHLEVDTGMGRAGFPAAEVGSWGPVVRATVAAGRLAWTGCYTHFHSADEPGGPGVTEQLARFRAALAVLDPPPDCLVHAANSAAALRLGRGAGVQGVRPGIFLYGGSAGADLPAPEPVVAVRARVVLVRDVPPGSTAGYGATYRATETERWATLAIGYGDGLPRALGDRGEALVAGRRAPLVGRLSMDMVVANLSRVAGVQPGDVATLVGRDGDEAISVDDVAERAGTIPYEILTRLSPRLPRIWIDDAPA